MKRPKLPRDSMERAFVVGEQSVSEPAEDVDALVQAFWEETGVIAPMVEIPKPLTDQWGEDERWRRWREWLVCRKMGAKGPDRKAAGRKGGLKGGKARAESLSPERRSEIAKKAAAARWGG